MSSHAKKTGPTLIKGTIKATGKAYTVHLLDNGWVDEIHALHEAVISHLKPEEKSYVVPKTKEYFEEQFKKGGVVVGAVLEGKLIGKAVLHEPTASDPDTGMVDMMAVATPDKMAMLQSDTIHPLFQGNGIAEKLLQARLLLALLHEREHVCSEVDVRNTASLKVYLRNGLTVHSIGTDPGDGTKVYNLHETVADAALKSAFKKAVAVNDNAGLSDENLEDLAGIERKLKAGFRGVGIQGGKMLFRPGKTG